MSVRDKGKKQPELFSYDSSTHAVAPEIAVRFFKQIMPFKELSQEVLQGLARHCRIDFFPQGTRLFTYQETEITHLHLIQRGGVRAFLTGDNGEVALKDYRGVGAPIGALGIIRGTRANLNIETIEDTFCFLIPRDIFLTLVKENSTVAHFFLKSFSDTVVATAYDELRSNKLARRSGEDLYLFKVTARDLSKALYSISATSSIQEAAAIMARRSIGSLLIYADEDPGSMIGIITDTDLRAKVIAHGLDYREPVTSIMSSPLKTVPASTLCFDILLKMMSTGIHHLGVESGGSVIGVVTSHDILVQQGNSPYYLFKEIVAESDFRELHSLGRKISGIVRNIINEGAKAGNITQMIALLNDQMLNRILTLLHEQLGPPPVKYAWLQLGSEGRREQTFKTDQDNAIVYADPADEKEARRAREYFGLLANRAVDHLVACGYPLCRLQTMANNPQWCQPLAAWQAIFRKWLARADSEALRMAGIFFDFRYGFGTEQLAIDLRDTVVLEMKKHSRLPYGLARQCLAQPAPLSFFNNRIVEKTGEHTDRFEIKKRGLSPVVDFARVMALRSGIRETNTLERLRLLKINEKISPDLYEATVDAYELQMQLRVIHQLAQIESGLEPDNDIAPEALTDLEKQMLKEAFAVIERLQQVLENLFPEA